MRDPDALFAGLSASYDVPVAMRGCITVMVSLIHRARRCGGPCGL